MAAAAPDKPPTHTLAPKQAPAADAELAAARSQVAERLSAAVAPSVGARGVGLSTSAACRDRLVVVARVRVAKQQAPLVDLAKLSGDIATAFRGMQLRRAYLEWEAEGNPTLFCVVVEVDSGLRPRKRDRATATLAAEFDRDERVRLAQSIRASVCACTEFGDSEVLDSVAALEQRSVRTRGEPTAAAAAAASAMSDEAKAKDGDDDAESDSGDTIMQTITVDLGEVSRTILQIVKEDLKIDDGDRTVAALRDLAAAYATIYTLLVDGTGSLAPQWDTVVDFVEQPASSAHRIVATTRALPREAAVALEPGVLAWVGEAGARRVAVTADVCMRRVSVHLPL